MTIVSTIITSDVTVHSADSLLTIPQVNGNGQIIGFKPHKWSEKKIIRVPHFHGAMSFWGLAGLGLFETTRSWLQGQANQASKFTSAHDFADKLAESLQRKLDNLNLGFDAHYGIGIHFTAYEEIATVGWVPEFFLISNYRDTSYANVDRKKVHVSRHTYLYCPGNDGSPGDHAHGQVKYRQAVNTFLSSDPFHWIIFNNGDPEMFNPVATAVLDQIRTSQSRLNLDLSNRAKMIQAASMMPIETVGKLQHRIYKPNRQLVGGATRSLIIRPPTKPLVVYEAIGGV